MGQAPLCYTLYMNSNAIKWGSLVLVIIFIFLWITVYIERPKEGGEEQVPVTVTAPVSDHPTYENSNYIVSYPEGFILSTSSPNSLFANGVSFIVPPSLTEGTTLSPDSRIYIEAKQGTSTCSALVANIELIGSSGSMEETVTYKDNTYRAVTYSEAGAGNFYETDVYAIGNTQNCYEITRFIHITNITNYEVGTVVSFDRAALDEAMRIVLESFKIK
jgi:hypothetical protein